MNWSRFSAGELERRRLASVDEMARRDRADFDRWYQEECDRHYWTHGQCCAGCDFWQSDWGWTGTCSAAGIVSGVDVIRSMGAGFCSYTPPPGFPFSKADGWCGKFRDDFDWSSLDSGYLRRIGAFDKVQRGQMPNAPSKEGS